MSSLQNCLRMYKLGAPVTSICKYMLGKFRKARLSEYRDIRKTYSTKYSEGKYSADWFSTHIPNWLMTFRDYQLEKLEHIKALEIGSFEGASSYFLVSSFPNLHLTCVDTWEGSDENVGIEGLDSIGDNFDENLRDHASQIEKFKGTSFSFFEATDDAMKYDFIYIDGSHHVDDVMVDAVRAFRLLKIGGIMIFDDYLWDFYRHAQDNPCAAINAFLRLKHDDLEIIYIGAQVHIRKTKSRERTS